MGREVWLSFWFLQNHPYECPSVRPSVNSSQFLPRTSSVRPLNSSQLSRVSPGPSGSIHLHTLDDVTSCRPNDNADKNDVSVSS